MREHYCPANDILEFSRTGRLEITFAEIDMEKMAHAVAEELQPSSDDGKIRPGLPDASLVAGLVPAAAKSFEQGDDAARIVGPGQTLTVNRDARGPAQAFPQSRIGAKPLDGRAECGDVGRIEEKRILAIGQYFANIGRCRRHDGAAERHVFEQLQRRGVSDDLGLHGDVEGRHVVGDFVTRHQSGEGHTIADVSCGCLAP